jgi:putative transcriptional regulator
LHYISANSSAQVGNGTERTVGQECSAILRVAGLAGGGRAGAVSVVAGDCGAVVAQSASDRSACQAAVMRNRVRELREDRRWSQAELGVRVGVSRQAIIAIETGRFDPSLPLAFKLARVFKLSIEDIFQDVSS